MSQLPDPEIHNFRANWTASNLPIDIFGGYKAVKVLPASQRTEYPDSILHDFWVTKNQQIQYLLCSSQTLIGCFFSVKMSGRVSHQQPQNQMSRRNKGCFHCSIYICRFDKYWISCFILPTTQSNRKHVCNVAYARYARIKKFPTYLFYIFSSLKTRLSTVPNNVKPADPWP